MRPQLTQFQRHQLALIARVTPHAMLGHLLNTTLLAIAVVGTIPTGELIVWVLGSYAIALLILVRHIRSRERQPRSFRRAAARATVYALLLALPWSGFAVMYLGQLARDQELILVALGVGMAAAGTVLLSAVPAAAFSYMTGILLPSAVKCLVFLGGKGYVLLGVLSLCYWWFLAAVVAKVGLEIRERKLADDALQESRTRLQEALTAGQVVAFTWNPETGLSERSENVSQVLGFEPSAGRTGGRSQFLVRVHPDDRAGYASLVRGLSPDNPSYSASFRFLRPDGRQVWLEETGRAEFDPDGRYLRLRGLTRDVTERQRAEERQQLLVRELDHRVKNVLASVATVAQRTREGSSSMDEFLRVFEGRIQSLANAHDLLSRGHWHGVSLAELVRNELAPFAVEGSVSIEGPEVQLSPEAAQPMAIVLHELVTNASKHGALTTPQGRIGVRWSWVPQGEPVGRLRLEWVETGGPAVLEPSQAGYGTGAIRSLIPYELKGAVDLAFDPGGVRCTIELPSEWARDGASLLDPFTTDDAAAGPAPETAAALRR